MTAIWWALKNWKALALVAAVLAIFTLGYKLRAAQDAYEQVATLQRRLGALQITAKVNEKNTAVDKAYIDKLEGMVRDTPRNDGACLDRDAARRLQRIR